MDKQERLKEVFLFSMMPEEQLKKLAEFCSFRKLKRNEILFLDEDKATSFYYIISGKVKIYKISPAGQEYTFEIHKSGDIFAEAAIFDRETYPANSQAIEDSELIQIPKNDFIALIIDSPRMTLKIMHAYSRRLRSLVDMIESLSMLDIKARLAKYLLQNCQSEGELCIFKYKSSKKELALLLGTIPESFSRALKFLKEKKIIEEKQKKIIIINKEKLKSFI